MNAIDESAIAIQTFLSYSQTFEQMVKTGDASIIVPFLHIPAILIAPDQDPILMASDSAITVVFGQLIQQLKDAQFDHSKLTSINAKGLSPTEVIISGTATRYKDAAETLILQSFGFTYTLRKSGIDWKIILGIIHGIETAITFG
jgi:hypothetical protein